MHQCRSRFSLYVFARLALWGAFLCFGVWSYSWAYKLSKLELGDEITWIFGGSIIFFPSLYILWWHYDVVDSVIMDEEKIKLGRRGYFYWKDLESMDLQTDEKSIVAKRRYMSNDAIMLKFKGKRAIYLFYVFYTNTGEMLEFLQKHVVGKR